MTADVVIYVDSVSIVCQSASSGSPPLPVPVACVEVGEDHSLPGLALRLVALSNLFFVFERQILFIFAGLLHDNMLMKHLKFQ
jgi:hypothetical protein